MHELVALQRFPNTVRDFVIRPRPPSEGGRHAAQPTVGQLVSEASTHFSTILQGEIALAKLELKSSLKHGLTGSGAFGAALVLLVFAFIFFWIGLAELFGRYLMPRWAGYFTVFGIMLLVIVLLVIIGIKKVKRVKAPQQTIATGKDTLAYLKANSRRSS